MPFPQKATGIPVHQSTKRPTSKAKLKSATTQTDPCPLIKEEPLRFFPLSKLGNDGMRRDYVKAINFVNSCHQFINSLAEKNNGSIGDKNNIFILPEVANFAPLFPVLATNMKKKTENERGTNKVQVSPKKRIAAVRKEDVVEKVESDSRKIKNDDEIEVLIKNQIGQFLATLQVEQKKRKQVVPRRNLDAVKEKLEDLSKICDMRRDLVTKTQMLDIVAPSNNFEDTASTVSDGESAEVKSSHEVNICVFDSVASLISESSDIKSDSELEINVDN